MRPASKLLCPFVVTHDFCRPQASKNVVMVWTKGCMDRFLDGSDTAETDFVRKEYRLAMQLKKNMVAVKHEDFVFPCPRKYGPCSRSTLCRGLASTKTPA